VEHRFDKAKVSRKIQLLENDYGKPSPVLQQFVLDSFQEVIGVGQKVIFSGEIDKQAAQEVVQSITPKVAWVYAMRWKLLPLLNSLKKDADRDVLAENLQLAYDKYSFVVTVYETSILPEEATATWEHKCACGDAKNGLGFLISDVCVMLMSIGLKIGKKLCKLCRYQQLGNNLSKDLQSMPAELWYRVKHWAVVTAMEADLYERFCIGVLSGMKECSENNMEYIDPGILRDLDMVEKWLSWNNGPNVGQVLISMFCCRLINVVTMPPR